MLEDEVSQIAEERPRRLRNNYRLDEVNMDHENSSNYVTRRVTHILEEKPYHLRRNDTGNNCDRKERNGVQLRHGLRRGKQVDYDESSLHGRKAEGLRERNISANPLLGSRRNSEVLRGL
jgi:hypothetical protein